MIDTIYVIPANVKASDALYSNLVYLFYYSSFTRNGPLFFKQSLGHRRQV
jgi:hypothetical protein